MTSTMTSSSERCRPHNRAAAVVEFYLLAPLFVLMLVGGVDLGRAYQAELAFEGGVMGIGRMIVSLPEYDERARGDAMRVADALLPPGWNRHINLQVRGLQKSDGVLRELFADTLFGRPQKVAARPAPQPDRLAEFERVIEINASYDYAAPMLGAVYQVKLKKTYISTHPRHDLASGPPRDLVDDCGSKGPAAPCGKHREQAEIVAPISGERDDG